MYFCAHAFLCTADVALVSSGERKMDPRADIRQLDNKKALREFHPGGLSYYEMIDAFAFFRIPAQ